MKSFNGFLAQLTPEKISEILDKAHQKDLLHKESSFTAFVGAIPKQIDETTLTVSIELLRLYHQWLQDE